MLFRLPAPAVFLFWDFKLTEAPQSQICSCHGEHRLHALFTRQMQLHCSRKQGFGLEDLHQMSMFRLWFAVGPPSKLHAPVWCEMGTFPRCVFPDFWSRAGRERIHPFNSSCNNQGLGDLGNFPNVSMAFWNEAAKNTRQALLHRV